MHRTIDVSMGLLSALTNCCISTTTIIKQQHHHHHYFQLSTSYLLSSLPFMQTSFNDPSSMPPGNSPPPFAPSSVSLYSTSPYITSNIAISYEEGVVALRGHRTTDPHRHDGMRQAALTNNSDGILEPHSHGSNALVSMMSSDDMVSTRIAFSSKLAFILYRCSCY